MLPKLIILSIWITSSIYWLVAARKASPSITQPWFSIRVVLGIALAICTGFMLAKLSAPTSLWPSMAGIMLTFVGIGIAVYARIKLGSNWAAPMAIKQAPSLVMSGPYRVVRHPIYFGFILAALGSAVAINLWFLVPAIVSSAFFTFSAFEEDKQLRQVFAKSYPKYQATTKLLIPYVL